MMGDELQACMHAHVCCWLFKTAQSSLLFVATKHSMAPYQLCDQLLRPLVLLLQACVILEAGQDRGCLHDRPQHKQVRKVQVLHTVPAGTYTRGISWQGRHTSFACASSR